MFGGAAQPGGDQQGADLVAVQADGVGLVVQAGPADMDRRGMLEEVLLHGVAVEARPRCTAAATLSPEPGHSLQGGGRRLSMSARRASKRRRPWSVHQAANWRRSST